VLWLAACLSALQLAKSNNAGGSKVISEIIFLQFRVGSGGESRVNGPLRKEMQSAGVHSVWQRAAGEPARACGCISDSTAMGQGQQIRGARDTDLEETGGSLLLPLLEQEGFHFFPTLSEAGGWLRPVDMSGLASSV